jgi:hypothetical protein
MKTKTKKIKKSNGKKSRVILTVPSRPPLETMDKKDLQQRVKALETMLKEVIGERDGIYKEYCRDREEFMRMRITKEEMDDMLKNGISGEDLLAEIEELLTSETK